MVICAVLGLARINPAVGAHEREGMATGFAGLKTPRQFHHLNIVVVAP